MFAGMDYTDELMVRIMKGEGFWADSETVLTATKRYLSIGSLDIKIADVKAMPGGMLPICLSVADSDVSVVSGLPKDGMIEFTLHSACEQCCPTSVTAAPCPKPSPNPCAAKPSPCVPQPSPCVPKPPCEKDAAIIPRWVQTTVMSP